METNWFLVLRNIMILSPILPLVSLLFSRNKASSPLRNTVLLLSGSSIFTDLICLWNPANIVLEIPVFYYLYSLTVGLAIIYYYRSIQLMNWSRSVFRFMAIGVVLTNVLEFLFTEGNPINQTSYTLLSMLVIFLAISYFYFKLNNVESRQDLFDESFWLTCAVFIYFGGTLFFTLFEDLIRNDQTINEPLLVIQHVVGIIYQLTLLKAVWTKKAV